MPANKPPSRTLRSFIPPDMLPAWEKSPKAAGAIQGLAQPCVADILKRLGDPGREYSGAIGPDWLSIDKGGRSCAPVAPRAFFTWHFHPSGEPAMSPEDWLVFLVSPAMVTALFTRDAIALFQKSEGTLVFSRQLAACFQANAQRPALAMRRAFALAAKSWECDLETWPDNRIAARLHVGHVTGAL